MQEPEIRGKGIFCILFALMIVLSIFIRERQRDGQWLEADGPTGTVTEDKGRKAHKEETEAIAATDDVAPRVALTFDDGPHPSYTKKLLDGLKERGVKATFFVVGENIPGREDIIRQMWEDGHLIGNHTYDHEDISRMTTEEACEELTKTSELVKEITGEGTAYVRPPFGNWDDSLDCAMTMISVKWSVDPLDWTTGNVSQVVNRVVTKTDDNDIILLHDYYNSSVEAALQIVDILQEKGFEFVTVEELLLE